MALNNLRDKLLEAGLVDEEQVREVEADEAKRQAHRRSKGRSKGRAKTAARPAEERLTPEELAAAEAKRAERERRAALDRERAENRRRAAAERAQAEDVRRVAEALGVETAGERVFFFQDRKGRIKRLMVSEEMEAGLEAGALAIIEHPLPHAIEHAVVPREGAEAVLKIAERSVRFYNRGPGEHYGASESATDPEG